MRVKEVGWTMMSLMNKVILKIDKSFLDKVIIMLFGMMMRGCLTQDLKKVQ